jgi:EAL domain-containing protein (putative c-di-GMP-specific phosphodiesterase class I)
VLNVSAIYDSLKLVIQPVGEESALALQEMGFQKVPMVPQLYYCRVSHDQIADLFFTISQLVPESLQAVSRFIITRSSLDSKSLLIEFLSAQTLTDITLLINNAWFLRVLARDQLFFNYQPIFDLSTHKVVAHECLARATSESGSCFSGQQLIEAALLMNLTREFDDLARSTCLDAVAQLTIGSGPLSHPQKFFINVLPNAIAADPKSFERNVQQVLELGLRPQQIVFELTETEAVGHCAELPRLIEQIHDWGFAVALDDLGSNVAIDHYCSGFRPDIIKLDRRLIQGCSQHLLKQVIIKSMLQSSHEIGILLLAEGIEDQADLDFCREIGIDMGQGFCLAMPALKPHPVNFEAKQYLMRAS